MLKYKFRVIILCTLLLAGCSSLADGSVLSPTSEPSITPTNNNIFEYQCLEVAQELPPGEHPQGIWVLENNSPKTGYVQFINLVTGEQRLMTKDDDDYWRSDFHVSPDGKWLAYERYAPLSLEPWLIVEDLNGQLYKQFPIGLAWDLVGWLDNEHLWLHNNYNNPDSKPTDEMVIVYSLAGDKQILLSNYPDIAPMINPSSFFFQDTNFIYHPSLDMVVYPQEIYLGNLEHEYSIVLWDRKADRAIAKVNEAIRGSSHVAIWSPDGEHVFVTAQLRDPEDIVGSTGELYEWFEMGIDGQVKQLTHLGYLSTNVYIGEASLSPDGRYLAFWLGEQSCQCCAACQLAILNTETLRVTNYCISGSSSSTPVWSGDGKYLAVKNYTDNGHYQAVLVDIEDGWAAKIGEDLTPIGWMVAP